MWADVPDPDVIRVGDDYWLVSTTMHLMPGGPIMHSKDLVHWQTVSYLFETIKDVPKYDLAPAAEGTSTVYGRGQWATSLKYHDGTYWALFSTNDEPHRSFLFRTDDPRHGWTLHARLPHFHDSSLFFDDDGRAYVFHGTGQLTELNKELTDTLASSINLTVFQRDQEENGLLEGSRVIKKDGKYYLIMISWPKDRPRRQVCYRADAITGPYEKKVILEDNFMNFPYAAQGTIVDDPQGNWYGFIFQDRGAIGRVPLLVPCRWVDGWPMLGDANGKVPLAAVGPKGCTPAAAASSVCCDPVAATQSIVVSDTFDGTTLDLLHWQWNHNPVEAAWKMTGEALRLETSRTVDNLFAAPNTLSQRMEGPLCSAWVEIDFSHLKDGDRAGFAAFNGHSGVLTICRDGKQTYLTCTHQTVNFTEPEHSIRDVDSEETARMPLTGKKICLRIDGDFRLGRDIATFYYSTDGTTWTPIGGEFQMRYDYQRLFMGTRYAIFCYATQKTGGYADFLQFVYNRTEDTAGAQDAAFQYFTYTGNDSRFDRDYDSETQYLNPILAGFYPDPSVCRVDDTYYLVTSSFSFFPGLPIFESKNLVDWTQIGHVLDRPSQLPLQGQNVSAGIFAPDIKYNPKNKTFYMITTNVGKGNFFVKTKDPHNGWSEPIYLPGIDGIDPSFFFDKNGRAYIVHNAPVMGGHDYEGQRAIRLLEFDVEGDSIIGQPKEIVRGGTHVEENPIWIEGPHLYRIGKYYYLMCAEGGTGDWHSEVVFRASIKADITRPEAWEECPHNPILTQRSGLNPERADIVTSTGHADLVQTPDGDWYAVFLGCRPYEGPYYNTGRDTYLLPVTWKNGWPTILEQGKAVPTVVSLPPAPSQGGGVKRPVEHPLLGRGQGGGYTGNFSYTDRFDTPQLNMRWMSLRNPSDFYVTGNGLTLHPKPVNISQKESPAALFVRQQHTNFTAETQLSFTPATENDLAGLVLLQNEHYNFVFGRTLVAGQPAITLTRAEKTNQCLSTILLPKEQANVPIRLKVEGRGRYYSFLYAIGDGPWQIVAQGVDAINLSTRRSDGFIGACIGLYATNNAIFTK